MISTLVSFHVERTFLLDNHGTVLQFLRKPLSLLGESFEDELRRLVFPNRIQSLSSTNDSFSFFLNHQDLDEKFFFRVLV